LAQRLRRQLIGQLFLLLTRRRFDEGRNRGNDRTLDVIDGVAGVVIGWRELARARSEADALAAVVVERRVAEGAPDLVVDDGKGELAELAVAHCQGHGKGAQLLIDCGRGDGVVKPGDDEYRRGFDVIVGTHGLDGAFGAFAKGPDVCVRLMAAILVAIGGRWRGWVENGVNWELELLAIFSQ